MESPSWMLPKWDGRMDQGLFAWLMAVWKLKHKIYVFGGDDTTQSNLIYNMYGSASDENTLPHNDLVLKEFVAEFKAQAAQHDHFFMLQYGPWDGFYFQCNKVADHSVTKRVYIHCKTPDLGLEVCRHLSMMMAITTFGIQQFKICAPGGFARLDSIVVYLATGRAGKDPNDYIQKTCKYLVNPIHGLTHCFADQLPSAVKHWEGAVGVGFADEPPKIGVLEDEAYDEAQSFGGFLSSLIYMALKETMESDPPYSWDKFVKNIYGIFQAVGIDPASPAQIGGAAFLTRVGQQQAENVTSWTKRKHKK